MIGFTMVNFSFLNLNVDWRVLILIYELELKLIPGPTDIPHMLVSRNMLQRPSIMCSTNCQEPLTIHYHIAKRLK